MSQPVRRRNGPTKEQIERRKEAIDQTPERLAKDQPARHLHRYHSSGDDPVLTFFGHLDEVAHEVIGMPDHGENTQEQILRCLTDTYGLSRRQLIGWRQSVDAAPFRQRQEVAIKVQSRGLNHVAS